MPTYTYMQYVWDEVYLYLHFLVEGIVRAILDTSMWVDTTLQVSSPPHTWGERFRAPVSSLGFPSQSQNTLCVAEDELECLSLLHAGIIGTYDRVLCTTS